VTVTETFISVEVSNMERATAFYAGAFGASVSFSSPAWTSLHVAGVRIGLAHVTGHVPGRMGLHFAVSDLEAARARVAGAGGRSDEAPIEVAPGVVIASIVDTEGNTLTLRGP
jgi:predicted enzyme related to lactoylglutathione lyase